jgi:hypothetical protein
MTPLYTVGTVGSVGTVGTVGTVGIPYFPRDRGYSHGLSLKRGNAEMNGVNRIVGTSHDSYGSHEATR